MNTLLRDLHTWDTLQVAGRLHKPVKHIIRDPAIMAAIDTNLESALVASLLTLPQAFTTVVRPPYMSHPPLLISSSLPALIRLTPLLLSVILLHSPLVLFLVSAENACCPF